MRLFSPLQTVGAVAALALLAGCAGGGTSALVPKPASPQSGARFTSSRLPNFLNPTYRVNILTHPVHRFAGHDSCPANGPIKYMSDYSNSVINIYAGRFAGQPACGQITSQIANPEGIYVEPRTHDLYVANSNGFDILVFHRGQTTPYNTYTDPTVQFPFDITVARDGTVIASNILQPSGGEGGSISTWTAGPNGGKFVGNFAMTNAFEGLFITAQKNGTIYFDDIDSGTGSGALWSLSCPAGACGAQTQVNVDLGMGFGMGSNGGDDLLINDAGQATGVADTFRLPNPQPSSFPLVGIPVGMSINQLDHHWFVTDILNDDVAEYIYPGGKLVGTVPGNSGGDPVDVAVDPGHAR